MGDEPEKVALETADVAAGAREALQSLFPGVINDGVLDSGRLGELLDVPVAQVPDGRERYGLQWAGKQEAIRSLLTPSRGTLVPDLENSIDFDSAENVFIEGDNLEVLKLLQKAYNDRVKLIYIDPPYNTGNDFVYNDDFSDGIRGYLEYTGQLDDDGKRTSANADTAGRKHSRWLNMMYPRLVLARNLLTQDGAIFVSIDDNEVKNLRALLDQVFGEENFVGQMIWAAGRKNDSKLISESHEYILVYGRNVAALIDSVGSWRTKKEGLDEIYAQYDKARRKHGNDSGAVEMAMKEWFSGLADSHPSKRHRHYSKVDSRGIFFASDLSKNSPTSRSRYEILHPDTGKPVSMPKNGWRYAPEQMEKLLAEDRIHFGPDESVRPNYKRYLTDAEYEIPYSVFYVDGRGASQRLKQMLGGAFFDNPKDEFVLQKIVEFASEDDDIVLDFFAGSGTLAHAVSLQNAADGCSRRYVLVNLPEAIDPKSEAHSSGFNTVSAITLARLHAVAARVERAQEQGLRVWALDQSNFRSAAATDDELELVESTLAWEETDWGAIAAEVLLKEGVPLDEPWSRVTVAGADVIVAGQVAVVLTLDIDEEVVEQALALDARVIVFLEDGFADSDAVKANAVTNAKNVNKTLKTI